MNYWTILNGGEVVAWNLPSEAEPDAVANGGDAVEMQSGFLNPSEHSRIGGEWVARPIVPASVLPLQIRKAIRQAGLKPAVDAYIATLDEEIIEEWEFALRIDRNHPLIAMAAAALEMTEEQVDDLFIQAAAL